MTKEQKIELMRLMADVEDCATRFERARVALDRSKASFENELCKILNAR